jgi:hypothetical protein
LAGVEGEFEAAATDGLLDDDADAVATMTLTEVDIEAELVEEDEEELADDEAEAMEAEEEIEDETAAVERAVEFEAPPTRTPVPQGMAEPSGCLALAGVVVAPEGLAMVNLVVQVGSNPPNENW